MRCIYVDIASVLPHTLYITIRLKKASSQHQDKSSWHLLKLWVFLLLLFFALASLHLGISLFSPRHGTCTAAAAWPRRAPLRQIAWPQVQETPSRFEADILSVDQSQRVQQWKNKYQIVLLVRDSINRTQQEKKTSHCYSGTWIPVSNKCKSLFDVPSRSSKLYKSVLQAN